MEEENQVKLSKYNSGIAQIYRLDNLWKDVNNHSRSGHFIKWNNDLDRVWCELARDLKEDEYIKKKKELDDIDNKLANSGKFNDNANESFEEPKANDITKRNLQYKLLMEKELFLRRLENLLGKGTAFDDEDDDIV